MFHSTQGQLTSAWDARVKHTRQGSQALVKDATNRSAHTRRRMEDMASRIKTLRIARGLTQQQLAEACGVTKAAVSQWENGLTANVKLKTFMSLCDALGTDPAFLIWGPARSRFPSVGTRK